MIIDNEVDFNESLIGQREEEIREIESGITELNEIFRDIGSMVYEQSSLLGI
jgi:syntaxin 7